MIELADGLVLPENAVTSSTALLAMKGAGKSNAAVVFAEQLFAAGIPWVCIDPKGDWWGIRSSANGKRQGLPVPIFGGLHADVPIEPGAGKLFADLVVDQHLTCLIDVSEFTKGESTRFLTGFFDHLYRRKNRATYPMHLFLEECDDYVPQQVRSDGALLKRTVELCVKRGRQRGLGITIATQRSASVHKDVLTQTDMLIVLRTTSPQDRKAIAGWLDYHAGGADILAELPTLQNGEAWVSAPQLGILKKVKFHQRTTFDSGATPELGEKVKAATLADIDVASITAKVGEVVERAQADDPKRLRARIVHLERELNQAQRAPVAEPERVEVEVVHQVPVMPAKLLRELEDLAAQAQALIDTYRLEEAALGVLARTTRTDVKSAPIKSAPQSHQLRKLGMKQVEIAAAVGVDQTHVSQRLTLLTYPDAIKNAVHQRDIGINDALAVPLELALRTDGRTLAAACRRGGQHLRQWVDSKIATHSGGMRLQRRVKSSINIDARLADRIRAKARAEGTDIGTWSERVLLAALDQEPVVAAH